MPLYQFDPSQRVTLLIGGKAEHAFGSLPVGPTCRMIIDHDSVTTNVVTLTVSVVEGNIPAVGDTIFVYTTANSAGALNQNTGIAISAVNIDRTTGKGTVSYPKTVSDQGNTADTGYALSKIAEVPEVMTTGVSKSRAFAIQNRVGGGYGISWAYTCPSAPATIAIQLEGAINNNDAEYTIIGTSQTSTTGYNEIFATVPELVNFVRLKITALTGGTNPSVIGKILNA